MFNQKRIKKLEDDVNALTGVLNQKTEDHENVLKQIVGAFDQREKEQEVTIAKLRADLVELTRRYDEIESKFNEMSAPMVEYVQLKSKRDSSEPYLNVISEEFDPEQGVRWKLDWNDAQINWLKRQGYTGVDDEAIIQRYLADTFRADLETFNN